MSKIGVIFCEGVESGLDEAMLLRIAPTGWTVHPAGGKHGLRSYARGFIANGNSVIGSSATNYLIFRDRDFDARPANLNRPELIPSGTGGKVWMSHRSCIESYLLTPELLHAYWEQNAQGPNWKHGPSPGIGAISSALREAASTLHPYQAIRWALASLRPGDRWPEIPNKLTDEDGTLPGDLAYEGCLNAAGELLQKYRSEVSAVALESFREVAEAELRRLSSPAFLTEGEYRWWVHGKDLKAALARQLNRGGHSLSLAHFLEWAARNFEWREHPDLLELEAKLSA